MISICLYAFMFLGLITLTFELIFWRKNRLFINQPARSIRNKAMVLGIILFIVFSIVNFLIPYPFGYNYKIYGFPFFIAILQREGHAWTDFVSNSIYLFISILLNSIIFGLIPQFFVYYKLKKIG